MANSNFKQSARKPNVMPVPPNLIEFMCFVGVAVMAAVLDYLHALKKGRVKWGLIAFALHVVLGAFIGSLCVMLAIGLGYDAWVGGAAAGMGGLLNVRAVELLENYLRAKGVIKLERRKEEK